MTDQGCDTHPITDWRFDVEAATIIVNGVEFVPAARLTLLEDVALPTLREIAGPTPTSHRKTVDQLTDAVKWRQGMARDALARLEAEAPREEGR